MAATETDLAKIADRLRDALRAGNGGLVKSVQALMAEAWLEGAEAAIQREHTYGAEAKARFANPYLGGGK